MSLHIEYLENPPHARIAAGGDVTAAAWNRVVDVLLAAQRDADIVARTANLDWAVFLQTVPRLADVRTDTGTVFTYNDAAREHLRRYREEYRAVRAVTLVRPALSEEEIQERLQESGFARVLTPAQRRDAVLLATLRNGANFSVPGAGKTTVAFAVHLLVRNGDTGLLVVAPKNAFTAWDEVLNECLDQMNPAADHTPFVRLEGGADAIRRVLAQGPARSIISYDQLIRVGEFIIDHLRTHPMHVILDESHRMKSGERSQRGSVLLNLAHLPARRDILSGTPIPRSIDDIAPQLDFLWPGQGLGRTVALSERPGDALRGLYVRTTKHELGLPQITREFISVPMSDAQLSMYSLMREQVLGRLARIRSDANIDLNSARRSVVRLLQVASNPILTVRRLTHESPDAFPYNDERLQAIFEAIVADSDSPKVLRACELAREIVQAGPENRVVIWSSFTENVERIAELLEDCGATFIHGGVPVGDVTDPNTREGRLLAFHASGGSCRVLVANPAACSEGISLHRVCHNAIYVDRTYNAAHYLQSVDRIHRLGLAPDTETRVVVLESVAPGVTGSIDFSVRRRLIAKLRTMSEALEDADLRRLALDEEEGEQPLDFDITLEDIADLIDELSGTAEGPGDEELA